MTNVLATDTRLLTHTWQLVFSTTKPFSTLYMPKECLGNNVNNSWHVAVHVWYVVKTRKQGNELLQRIKLNR